MPWNALVRILGLDSVELAKAYKNLAIQKVAYLYTYYVLGLVTGL
jgi:hypothetical protein